jgi:hypothetical protein
LAIDFSLFVTTLVGPEHNNSPISRVAFIPTASKTAAQTKTAPIEADVLARCAPDMSRMGSETQGVCGNGVTVLIVMSRKSGEFFVYGGSPSSEQFVSVNTYL